LEVADVLFVGVLATALALAGVFVVGSLLIDFPQFHEVARDPETFLRTQPYDAIAGAATVVVLSVGGTLAVAALAYRKHEKSIRPGSSVWHDVFREGRKDRNISVSVELADGRIVEGLFLSHVMDTEAAEKDLALQAPMYVWPATTSDGERDRLRLPNDRVIIPGASIQTVWVRYLWDRN
jgi:hypothetical protein